MTHRAGWSVVMTILVAFTVSVGSLSAQTCSCARSPVSNNLEGRAVESGTWQIGLIYEYHPITDVYLGTRELPLDNRERLSHTGILDITYGYSERWSFTTQLTMTRQERRSRDLLGATSSLRTRGVGDALLLARYNVILPNRGRRSQVSIGGGLSVPLGKSSLTNNGALIAADMQPGSGSWNGLIWGYANQSLTADYSTSMYGSVAYRITGSSDRGGSFSAGYQTGHELTASLGLTQRWTSRFDLNLALELRKAAPDRIGTQTVPNTGGSWLNIGPGLNLNWSKSFTLRLEGQLPLHRNVEGIQATTSYLVSAAIYYTFPNEQSFGIQP